MSFNEDVAIIGVGMHPFGRTPDRSGREQGAHAVRAALADAGLAWSDVGIAYGGSQDAGNADALVNDLGLTGLPFVNVANGCATGGSSLASVVAAIRSGVAEIGVAVGFDKHPRGAFNPKPRNWGLEDWYGQTGLMLTTQFFALKIRRYMHEHGITDDALVRVAERAYANGALNPQAWRRNAMSCDEIANSAMVSEPLRQFMFCNPAEGGAAVVLCRASVARRYQARPVRVRAAVVRTRHHGSFEVFSPMLAAQAAPAPTVTASRAAFDAAGVSPADIDVLQLQDTDSGSEIMHMAENGFCEHGEQPRLLASGATAIGGRLPINTDGGCLANGEPVGASGLRQVIEICLQLRGEAGARQVPGQPRLGYTHVYGAPGVSGVTILESL
ncbi:MAG: thiolase family protein [Burkholderiales bacterium]|nr:thiolase family protein [Burkholderiales bacterium]MDE1927188.1 thiolase family protein [Burkholderiales bacterium]MDE2158433.1 thiolase family protein [Burkholderiales bacterium]MDE2505040.1 thiolase family protein [Burkholderiales bacterium]